MKHVDVRPDWLARHDEAVLEPELPIIDAHHHLYDRADNRYLADDLRADTASGHAIRTTVFIECRTRYRASGDPLLAPVGETAYVAETAEASAQPICGAIVGYVDLQAGARAGEILAAHVDAGKGRFRGVRNVSAWHADPAARGSSREPAPPDLLRRAAFREGFACLAPAGLSFDAWLYHSQIDDLVDLARAFPETAIVLDHLGGPIGIGPYADRRAEVLADWRAALRRLAACENVRIKIGGFGMRLFGFGLHERPAPPDSETLAAAWRPYVETAIDAFGPSRAMLESNFPVDKGTCSYCVLWNAFKRVTHGYAAEERAALFAGTAQRFYRLERPAAPLV